MSKWKKMNCSSGGGAVYGLGLVGAVVYFLQQAPTLSDKLMGLLKAIVWPAFLIYKLMAFLQL